MGLENDESTGPLNLKNLWPRFDITICGYEATQDWKMETRNLEGQNFQEIWERLESFGELSLIDVKANNNSMLMNNIED